MLAIASKYKTLACKHAFTFATGAVWTIEQARQIEAERDLVQEAWRAAREEDSSFQRTLGRERTQQSASVG
jgi:hypothetical protein